MILNYDQFENMIMEKLITFNGKVYPKVEVGQVPQIIEDYKAQANA